MKPFFFALIVLSISTISKINYAQNIVPNHSFEQYDTCPNFFAELNKVAFWFNPTIATPDYFNACYVPGVYPYIDVPLSNFGYQMAKDGNAYVGLVAFWSLPVTWREYIEVKLLTPLQANEVYHVHFYVSLADSSIYATDDLGACFIQDSLTQQSYGALTLQPQIENAEGNFLSNTLSWTEIKGDYIATGGENYLVIGNFKDQQNTDSIQVLPYDSAYPFPFVLAYYWIDDVCVAKDSSECERELSVSEVVSQDGSLIISPNPVNDFLIIHCAYSFFRVKVINLLGQIERDQMNPPGLRTLQLDVADLSEGYYFIQVETEKKVFIDKVLVK